jgi:1-deoxy-D-xylulose-5-phosphate synthase
VVVEDNGVAGGVGSAISRELRARGIDVPVRDMALPQQFFTHGTRSDVLAGAGLSAQEVARRVVEAAANASSTAVSPR